MESSFDVVEWESTSKEQDSLVYQLFGDISTSNTCSNSAVLKSDWSTAQEEKRKALKNEQSTGKLKKKRKDKRQKNKFKQDQNLSAEQAETTISKASNDLAASEEFVEAVSVHTTCERSIGHERKKAKKKKRADQTKEEVASYKKGKRKIKSDQKLNSQFTGYRDNQSETICNDEISPIKRTNQMASINSVNQFKMDVDPATPQNAEFEDFEESDLMHKSIEGQSESESKKVKKKKRRDKRKLDDSRDDLEFSNTGESTPETNHMQKRRKKTSESEHKEQIHSPELRDTNSNILSPYTPRSKSSLHEKMTKQLESSRFRWINEQLYTTTGDEAVALFSKDPNLFDIYHRGFTNQVKLWPVNPVDKIIEWLKMR